MTDTITISVDPDLADAYRAASDQDRRKLHLFLNLRLRDIMRTRRVHLRCHGGDQREMRGRVA